MADDAMMRFRLQQVAAYRELCRSIRGSGRGNVVFAGLMLFLAYLTANVQPAWVLALYVGLALAELAAGLFKAVAPSAEGVLLDAFILLLFALFNVGMQGLRFLAGAQPSPVIAFFGLYLLWSAVGRFRAYGHLRRLFADRPTADQIAWFNDLVHEIRTADPETDDQALDLPTRPAWKAKLLGTTAFVVAPKGDAAVVAGPDDFALAVDRVHPKTGAVRVALRIYDEAYPAFVIDPASWANYQKWAAANADQQA
jgi:hypothetical protein